MSEPTITEWRRARKKKRPEPQMFGAEKAFFYLLASSSVIAFSVLLAGAALETWAGR